MGLLYITRHIYSRREDGRIYSSGCMGTSYFEKYLPFFDTVTILGYVTENIGKRPVQNGSEEAQNTERIFFHLISCSGRSYNTFYSNKGFRKAAAEEVCHADAVICKSASAVAFASDLARRYKKPYLIEIVGCPWDSLRNHSPAGKILAPFMYFQLKKEAKRAPFVLYVTTSFLQKRYPTRGISAGVSDVELPPAGEEVLEKRLDKIYSGEHTLHIGTAGSLSTRYKGQGFVMEAMEILKKRGMENIVYHLAGPGDPEHLQKKAVQTGTADQVVFEGRLKHEDLMAWMDRMDIYIQPSLTEGLPRSVVEAMSRGLPVLGSNVGGISELLEKEAVFHSKKPGEIADIIQGLTPEIMAASAKRNYAFARRFAKETLDKKRIRLYEEFSKKSKI